MAIYNFERLHQTLRVSFENIGFPGIHVLVVPDPREGDTYRDFYLVREDTGEAVFMFGLDVDSDEHAALLATTNGWRLAKDIEEEREEE